MAYITRELLDTIVGLYVDDGGQRSLVGTGFIVGATSKYGITLFPYLVTAKHVWELFPGRQVFARLNKLDESGPEFIPLNDKWEFHPDPTVDLAVTHVGNLDNYTGKIRLFISYLDRIKSDIVHIKQQGYSWPPPAGEDVLFSAMLVHYTGKQKHIPYARRGHIALVTDETIKGYYGESSYHLIDAQCYPGNSGAPVWSLWNKVTAQGILTANYEALLLGVLVGGYPEEEEVLQKTVSGKVTRNSYLNLGISLVVPIEKVSDILERMADMRNKIDEKKCSGTSPYPVRVDLTSKEDAPFTVEEFEKALKKVSRKLEPDSSESDQGKA